MASKNVILQMKLEDILTDIMVRTGASAPDNLENNELFFKVL